MDVRLLLLATLDDLGSEDFRRFTWQLSYLNLDGYKAIPKGHTENAPRHDIVEKMVNKYRKEGAVTVTIEVLEKMANFEAADNLRTAFKKGLGEGKAAEQNLPPPPSTSSPALPPPASVTITAQSGSVVIAPTISGGSTVGPLNMNVK